MKIRVWINERVCEVEECGTADRIREAAMVRREGAIVLEARDGWRVLPLDAQRRVVVNESFIVAGDRDEAIQERVAPSDWARYASESEGL